MAWYFIFNDYFEDLTVESTIELLEKLKKGEAVKPGSLLGRKGSAPDKLSDAHLDAFKKTQKAG